MMSQYIIYLYILLQKTNLKFMRNNKFGTIKVISVYTFVFLNNLN